MRAYIPAIRGLLIFTLLFALCIISVGCNTVVGDLPDETTAEETTVEETTAEETTVEETTAEETTAEETTAEETTVEETTEEETTVEETTAEETTEEETTAEETTEEETTAEETTAEETTAEEITEADTEEYTVVFVIGDNTFTKTVMSGECVIAPDIDADQAYKYDMWFTSENGKTRFKLSTPITEDITLYAREITLVGKCDKPEITGVVYSQFNRVCIYGKAEPGTVICVEGKEETTLCEDGIFAIDVYASSGLGHLDIYATSTGKNPSDTERADIGRASMNQERDVIVGERGFMYAYKITGKDFLRTRTYTEDQLEQRKKKLVSVINKVHSVSPDTKVIYLMAPNKATVYPEFLPEWVLEKKAEGVKTRLELLTEAMQDTDCTFINLTDYLVSKKTDGEFDEYYLYNKTDTHWNELGAYYAYEYLMNEVIAKDFPAAKAIPLSKFDVYKKEIGGGDMVWGLGISATFCRENSVFVRPKDFEFSSGYNKPFAMNAANDWTEQKRETIINDSSLPTMVMYRDSFNMNMFNFLSENFSHAHYAAMYGHSVSYKLIEMLKPDYLIIECIERNIESSLFQ